MSSSNSFDIYMTKFSDTTDPNVVFYIIKFIAHAYINYINSPLNDTIRFRNSFIKYIQTIKEIKQKLVSKNIKIDLVLNFCYNFIVEYYKTKQCYFGTGYTDETEDKVFRILILLANKLIDCYKDDNLYIESDVIKKLCGFNTLDECEEYINKIIITEQCFNIEKMSPLFNESQLIDMCNSMKNSKNWNIGKLVKYVQKTGYENYTKMNLPPAIFALLNYDIVSHSLDMLITGILGSNTCLLTSKLTQIANYIFDMIVMFLSI